MGLFTALVDKSIDKAMDYILRNCIIYNVAWEDPRIDGKVLQIGEEDTMLMLTTGGCNVLDRLLDGAKHIVSVDLNVAQNALLELKLAGARALTHEQFFQLFAHSNRKLFDAVYAQRLRPLLSPSAAAFWDTHASFFDGVMYSGASGGLARALCFLAWIFGLQPLVRAMLTCKTLEEQRAAFAEHSGKVKTLERVFLFLLPVFCPFAGVPASQLRLEESSRQPGSPDNIIALFFHRIFHMTHIASDNYFYYGYLYGKYSRTCCPRYLMPENFEALKAAATRVTVKTKFLHEAAAEYPDGYFTAMVLLDHMDWLSNEQVQQEWSVFCRKLDPLAGRVLWRSFAYDLRSTPPLKFLSFNPSVVDQAEAETPDRVGMYNSCHIATIPPKLAICEAPPVPVTTLPSMATRAFHLMQTAAGLVAATLGYAAACVTAYVPLIGDLVAPLLASLLEVLTSILFSLCGEATTATDVAPAGKRTMLGLLPGLEGGLWVDLGGGLADELKAQRAENVTHFGAVDLVALPGQPMAQETKTLSSLRHTVSEGSALVTRKGPKVRETSLSSLELDASGLTPASADLVTLSHSLVDEADWEARLELALGLLKQGGYLAVADFSPPAGEASAAFWQAVQPRRSAAPHHAKVVGRLYQATVEVHEEKAAAKTPVLSAATPAHFVYIGRKTA